MRGKRSKEIRHYAENKTVGQPPSETRRVIGWMKIEYFKYTHPARPTAPTPGGFFCCQPASAERQRLIQSRFDPTSA